jgi:hypothetical protein
MWRPFGIVFVATLFLQVTLRSQNPHKKTAHAPDSRPLTLVETKKLESEPGGILVLPERCDGSNLYLRIGAGERGLIRKIGLDGTRVALLSTAVPNTPRARLGRFNVDGDGNVYQLASVGVQRHLFVFGSDGNLKSNVQLDPGFDWLPAHVAPFSSGDLLVSGFLVRLDSGEQTRRPFTGIFSSDGTFRKEVKLPDDEELHKSAESGDAHLVGPSHSVNNRAFNFGSAETAPDGNVYLMRASNPPIVYSISAGGEVVERFVVDPGDASFSVLEPLHVLGSRLAVLFDDDRTGNELVKIVNTHGEPLTTYTAASRPHSPGPGLACWTAPDRFAFVSTSEDGYLSLSFVEPR